MCSDSSRPAFTWGRVVSLHLGGVKEPRIRLVGTGNGRMLFVRAVHFSGVGGGGEKYIGEILAANKCTNRFGGGLPAKKDECGQFVLRGRGSSFLPFGTFWLGNQLKTESSSKHIAFR